MCSLEAQEESSSHVVVGRVSVHRGMCWDELSAALSRIFTSYLQVVCGESQTGQLEQNPPLGLGFSSFASVLVGEIKTEFPSLRMRVPYFPHSYHAAQS